MDYELDWSAELLVGELHALMNRPYRAWTGAEVELLLREAFHTEIPAQDFARLHELAEWSNDPAPTREWLHDLRTHQSELRPHTPPRPYWAARRAGPVEPPTPDPAAADLYGQPVVVDPEEQKTRCLVLVDEDQVERIEYQPPTERES